MCVTVASTKCTKSIKKHKCAVNMIACNVASNNECTTNNHV